MALVITISGTASEIIEYGKALERGMRPKLNSAEKARLKVENEYLRCIVMQSVISAIKECRSNNGSEVTGTLKGAKDYIEALIVRAMADGRLVCEKRGEYPVSSTYNYGPSFKP